ncbi:MAG: hypothetical protein MUC80_10210, partial [Candidatus Thermoplasmatota archaeon]|nr:hypothetical protein [Candidatus Thermoplasmatota archaeon]
SLEQDSPLFITRTLRATNQQLDAIIPEYLGKGSNDFLNLQIQENRMEGAKQFLRIIMKLDKKTFEQLATQESLKGLFFEEFSHTDPQILPTCDSFTACGNWAPGCYLKEILAMIIAFIKNGFQWPTYTWFCWHSGQVPCNVDIFNRS